MKKLKNYIAPELDITGDYLADVLTGSDHDTTWDDDYII